MSEVEKIAKDIWSRNIKSVYDVCEPYQQGIKERLGDNGLELVEDCLKENWNKWETEMREYFNQAMAELNNIQIPNLPPAIPPKSTYHLAYSISSDGASIVIGKRTGDNLEIIKVIDKGDGLINLTDLVRGEKLC